MGKVNKVAPWLGTLIAAGLTLLVWQLAVESEYLQAKREFEQHAAYVLSAVERNLATSTEVVQSIEGFFNSSVEVDRGEFAVFTRSTLKRHASIQALEWAPRVTHAARAGYETQAREDGLTDFAICETRNDALMPAARRTEYFPVYYVAPLQPNLSALGFDLASDPARREAMELARDSGQAVATSAITLVQESGQQKGFLLFVPVYEQNQIVETVAQRRRHLKGFALGVYRIWDLVEAALPPVGDVGSVNLMLYDRSATAQEQLLYSHGSHPEGGAVADLDTAYEPPVKSHRLVVGGREWEAVARPPGHELAAGGLLPWLILLAGAVATGLAYLYLRTMVKRDAALEGLIQNRAKLERSERYSKAVLHTVKDSIITMDSEGLIRSCNPATERIFGYSSDALTGQKVNMLMPAGDAQNHDRHLNRYLKTSESHIIGAGRELRGLRSDGTEFLMELQVVPMNIEQEVFFTGVIRDITERKQAEALLLKEKEASDAANRAKSAFLATMSHEIRTPMNGVVGMVDVLGRTELSTGQQDVLATIRDSSFSLLNIIDDVLDFSKIEAGRLELERTPLDLTLLVEGVVDTMSEAAHNKGVELLVFCDPALGNIYGDPVRLRQILFNLTSNAIKFSDCDRDKSGQVIVSAERERLAAGDEVVLFRVQDSGVGMSPEGLSRLSRLFQPFVQGEESTTRRFGGTGLGLTISRRLLDIMDGTIEVESAGGEGATFRCRIPFRPAPIVEPAQRFDLSGMEVLLVSRDLRRSGYLERYLVSAGARVLLPAAGEDPVDLALALVGDGTAMPLLVIDHEDSDNGEPLRSRCRGIPALDGLRFVMLTRGRRRCPRQELDDSVTLDLDGMHRSVFLRAVAAAAGRVSLEPLVEAEAIPVSPGIVPSILQARAQGQLILVAEDNKTNQKVLTHQLRGLGYAAEVVDDGREALQCWRSGSYALLLTDCHMPVMDGYALTRAIRQEEREKGLTAIPIVAITADALRGTARRCREAGMDDYLTKPLRIDNLQKVLGRWLFARERVGAVAVNETVAGPTEASRVVEVSALAAVLGTDEPSVLAGFYRDFICSGGSNVADIQAAHRQGDCQAVARLCHKLKSSARSVGAHALADCCQALERADKDDERSQVEPLVEQLLQRFDEVRRWEQELLRGDSGSD